MAVAERVGMAKAELRIPVENVEQERSVMNTIWVAAEEAALPANDIVEIFLLLISLSKKIQHSVAKNNGVKSNKTKGETIHGLGYWTQHGFTPVPSGEFTEAEIIAANGGHSTGAGYKDPIGEDRELPSYHRRWSEWQKSTAKQEE